MPNFPNIILYAIPFFIVAMLVELVVTTRTQLRHVKGYKPKDAFASIAMGLGNVILGFASKASAFKASFMTVGLWWLLFTIPMMMKVEQWKKSSIDKGIFLDNFLGRGIIII